MPDIIVKEDMTEPTETASTVAETEKSPSPEEVSRDAHATLEAVRRTIENCENVLANPVSVDTRRASDDLDAKWANFQRLFDEMNSRLIQSIGGQMRNEGYPVTGTVASMQSISEEDEGLSEEERKGVLDYDFSIEKVAHLISSGKVKKIVVMAGAGISVSAGIPDFRSAGGLYANLDKYNLPSLPSPEHLFSIDYFRENPMAFTLRSKDMMPGTFAPTPTHHFIKLLAQKNVLHRLYTQNIDTLELLAGIPEEKTVFAHGSFSDVHCINPDCGERMELQKWRFFIEKQEPPRCDKCAEQALVKPDIVFFGENLPERFAKLRHDDLEEADMLIIIGTSLAVSPFCNLVQMCGPKTPRILINNEAVGTNLGLAYKEEPGLMNYRDVFLKGTCDEQITSLCEWMGWSEELKELIEAQKSVSQNGWTRMVEAQARL